MQNTRRTRMEKFEVNIPAERVRQQIASILTAWGMDADLVCTTADAMLYSDLAHDS